MKTDKNKISVKQLLFVFTIIVSSPATRFLPKYTAAKADQAAWVSPIISAVPFIMMLLIIDSLMKKYDGKSMSDIIRIILGKYLGTPVVVIYLLWAVWLSAMYTRYYVERLTSSIYPNLDNNVLLVLTLIPIAYLLRPGFTIIARMSEVLLPFIGAVLVMLSLFLLPLVRSDNVLPIYYTDILPIFKASLASTAILSYLFLLFFLGGSLVNLKSLRVFGYIATYINISSLILLMFITTGVLGSSVAQRAPMPVLITVKQVSLMDTIENIEAVIIAIWIFADFTFISTLFVVVLNIAKSLFKLPDAKYLINIYAVLVYFLAMGICSTKFELEEFSNTFLVPLNLILGYGFPAILFLLSKLKKGGKQNKNVENTNQPSSTE